MLQRKKFKTGKRTPPARRKDDVHSSGEFTTRRKEDAMALAQLAYDMFVEQEATDEEAAVQTNVNGQL
jgi:hypothetical protein